MPTKRHILLLAALIAPLAPVLAPAQQDGASIIRQSTPGETRFPPEMALDRLQFLVGEWLGDGSGQPGQGTGGFSMRFELGGKVLIRRNRADYPATPERPAFSHEDLMVTYLDTERDGLRAVYWDNEGHVIHYAVTAPAEERAEFVSDAAAPGPRYRLTYVKTAANLLSITFEIAPPGRPDAFKTYIQAKARRAGF